MIEPTLLKDTAPLAPPPSSSRMIEHFTDERLGAKLMAMGVLPGSSIQFIRRAPFGGGWYVRIDRQHIALRQQEVACIVVK